MKRKIYIIAAAAIVLMIVVAAAACVNKGKQKENPVSSISEEKETVTDQKQAVGQAEADDTEAEAE